MIVLKVKKTKNFTNYIPSIPLNKIIEFSDYKNKDWVYDRVKNEIYLIVDAESQDLGKNESEVKEEEKLDVKKVVNKKKQDKKTKERNLSRRERRKKSR